MGTANALRHTCRPAHLAPIDRPARVGIWFRRDLVTVTIQLTVAKSRHCPLNYYATLIALLDNPAANDIVFAETTTIRMGSHTPVYLGGSDG